MFKKTALFLMDGFPKSHHPHHPGHPHNQQPHHPRYSYHHHHVYHHLDPPEHDFQGWRVKDADRL